MYLVVVDSYSKWSKVFKMRSATTTASIEKLSAVFAQFGNPRTLVTDNGAQFKSRNLKGFRQSRDISHLNSSPFHSASNGQAKKFVDMFKRTFKKLRREEGRWKSLQLMLKMYRNTPRPCGETLAELFLNREIRAEPSLLQPEPEASAQSAGHGAAREPRKSASRRGGREPAVSIQVTKSTRRITE